MQKFDPKIVRLGPRPGNFPQSALRDPSRPLELWGGLECSHVTIAGETRDQLSETGHLDREDDLDRIAELGIRTIRYPILWAHSLREDGVSLHSHARRLARMDSLGITPIVGFLHHGCGPGGMLPTEPGFVEGLADYAEQVVRRFPGLRHFTPINEPVTTARIACLYGHWEPHTRDTPTFLRHVVAYAEATAEAMRRIRAIRPDAMLVQTEDVGRVFATEALARQATYENERRYLGFDLLCGRVGPGHPFWNELLAAGIAPERLAALADQPCPPDVIGIDQYLTSDRFLDHRLERYPDEPVGGNGRQSYVDVAAVRNRDLDDDVGLLARLRELHQRYGLPIAVTEVHNGCTREEQLRWLMDAWNAGLAARAEGIDLRAVTIWSLFGAIDWNSLLNARRGFYESGAFDVRHVPPHETAIGAAARALTRDGRFDHPTLGRPGWWRAEAPGGDAGPALLVDGPSDLVADLVACCARRRIDTVGAGDAAADALDIWGRLTLEEAGRGYRFAFNDGAESPLEIYVEPGADLICATDAVLDMAIDGLTGQFSAEGLGPHCQYRLVPVAADTRRAERSARRRR